MEFADTLQTDGVTNDIVHLKNEPVKQSEISLITFTLLGLTANELLTGNNVDESVLPVVERHLRTFRDTSRDDIADALMVAITEGDVEGLMLTEGDGIWKMTLVLLKFLLDVSQDLDTAGPLLLQAAKLAFSVS